MIEHDVTLIFKLYPGMDFSTSRLVNEIRQGNNHYEIFKRGKLNSQLMQKVNDAKHRKDIDR
jgi:hypothetical protein